MMMSVMSGSKMMHDMNMMKDESKKKARRRGLMPEPMDDEMSAKESKEDMMTQHRPPMKKRHSAMK